MEMKPLCLLLCFLTMFLCMLSISGGDASLETRGRRILMMTMKPMREEVKAQVAELVEAGTEVVSAEGDHGSRDEEEVIYHIDYHGVKTHPNPLPKHPKP
ncbi:hypothetical protein QJS10_CPA02g01531 [Acorus calamus]|uniref:Uncharacterized protein n=1 Tax=Acorus calamus TaxID=4465 RepID=A0AAV9FAL0_ACOCL|nr:hypothetical protein QJS10_CPA02g01531 [Acorus calamus]